MPNVCLIHNNIFSVKVLQDYGYDIVFLVGGGQFEVSGYLGLNRH